MGKLLLLRFLKNRKLPWPPAVHSSLPSFVISPREQHSRMTHLQTGRRSPLETGGDLGQALTSCAWFPDLSSGQPPASLPGSLWNTTKGRTQSMLKIIFEKRMQNTDNPLTPTHVPHTKPLSKSSPILLLAAGMHQHSCFLRGAGAL